MDYRSLLAIPLAALALSASSADSLRVPAGWSAGSSFTWPASTPFLVGIAPESDTPGQRALTVQSLGERQPTELGAVWQSLMGFAGKRVRFAAQVKARGADGWAGIVLREGFLPLYVLPADPAEAEPAANAAAPACPDWCEVSVVADIPTEGFGAATVGLALIGNGQVWGRGFKLEVVGRDVPLTPLAFAAEQTAALRAAAQGSRHATTAQPAPPQNLALQ